MLVNSERPYVHMFEHGVVRLSKRTKPVQVVRVLAAWMEDDIIIKCDVADTDERKRVGLQEYANLGESEGLYFPYPEGADVTFHQGSVPFSLDLIFLKNSAIVKIEHSTQVGGTEHWSCEAVDGVIEVNGGFCARRAIRVGERLALFANSKQDEHNWSDEKSGIGYQPTVGTSLVGEVARSL